MPGSSPSLHLSVMSGKRVVDPEKLRPVSRLGGNVYSHLTELFEMPRPDKDGNFPPHKTRVQLSEGSESRKSHL